MEAAGDTATPDLVGPASKALSKWMAKRKSLRFHSQAEL